MDRDDDVFVERLRDHIHRLILLRETGPQRAVWHAARARLIWRLQEEVKRRSGEQDRFVGMSDDCGYAAVVREQ